MMLTRSRRLLEVLKSRNTSELCNVTRKKSYKSRYDLLLPRLCTADAELGKPSATSLWPCYYAVYALYSALRDQAIRIM